MLDYVHPLTLFIISPSDSVANLTALWLKLNFSWSQSPKCHSETEARFISCVEQLFSTVLFLAPSCNHIMIWKVIIRHNATLFSNLTLIWYCDLPLWVSKGHSWAAGLVNILMLMNRRDTVGFVSSKMFTERRTKTLTSVTVTLWKYYTLLILSQLSSN